MDYGYEGKKKLGNSEIVYLQGSCGTFYPPSGLEHYC
jgi:hypothetical protein